MQNTPLKIKYAELVGTSFTPRSMSRCNGIIQATVKGQGRDFIGDWPADNYVRWAHCFGLIKYNYTDDTFEITDKGLELATARETGEDLSNKEKNCLLTLFGISSGYKNIDIAFRNGGCSSYKI